MLNNMLLVVDIVGIVIFLSTLIVLFGGLTIRMIIIQKRDKKLYESLSIGSYVQTISGICGKIVGFKETDKQVFVLIQSGDTSHKSYITMDIESVYKIVDDPGEILSDEISVKSARDSEQIVDGQE